MALRKRLYMSLLVVTILALLAPSTLLAQESVNPPPIPVNGVARIDGNLSEWDTTADFFGNLYADGITTNPILGRYYLRFDCRPNNRYLFIMVAAANGARFNTGANSSSFDIFHTNLNQWVTYVFNNTPDNNSPPDAAWEQPFNPGNQLRWEGSIQPLNYAIHRVRVRWSVFDAGGIQRTIFPSNGEDDLQLDGTGCALAVELNSFTATPQSDSILLEWETASETNNLGFNLYRSTSPDEVGDPLNGELIPSAAPGSGQGASYEFVDSTGVGGTTYYYHLESVDLDGTRTMHGPIDATYPSVPTAIAMALFNVEAHDPRWAFIMGATAVGLAGTLAWRWRYRRRATSA